MYSQSVSCKWYPILVWAVVVCILRTIILQHWRYWSSWRYKLKVLVYRFIYLGLRSANVERIFSEQYLFEERKTPISLVWTKNMIMFQGGFAAFTKSRKFLLKVSQPGILTEKFHWCKKFPVEHSKMLVFHSDAVRSLQYKREMLYQVRLKFCHPHYLKWYPAIISSCYRYLRCKK